MTISQRQATLAAGILFLDRSYVAWATVATAYTIGFLQRVSPQSVSLSFMAGFHTDASCVAMLASSYSWGYTLMQIPVRRAPMSSEAKPSPCDFGVTGYRQDQLRYLFLDPFDIGEGANTINTFCATTTTSPRSVRSGVGRRRLVPVGRQRLHVSPSKDIRQPVDGWSRESICTSQCSWWAARRTSDPLHWFGLL
jgi:hypothetical protein